MAKRTFIVDFRGTVTLELDDAVIVAVDQEWQDTFYHLDTPEAIAEHLAYNVVANHAQLSYLDGWADQPDSNMKVVGGGIDWDGFEVRRQRH